MSARRWVPERAGRGFDVPIAVIRRSGGGRVLHRRTFVAGLTSLAIPLEARGHPSSLPVIGFLNGASYELSKHLVRAFHQGLTEAGYVEGRNVAIEYRSAEGKYNRLPALAVELARRPVNVLVATGTPTGLPAKAATTTIPIVFVTGSDPVEQGLVTNLSRPDGNLTGATTLAVELGRKRMELLREVVPAATLVGVLINPTGPNLKPVLQDMHAAARSTGLPIHIVHASTEPDLEAAFSSLVQRRVGGLVIGTDTFFNSQSSRLGALTIRHVLPAIYQYREFVAAGGLMSYAGSITDAYRMAGIYTGRILKGAKPADLPVQQSTKAELFINLKTARALGLKVPPSLMARAEEIIE
jgi:putative tryptophan/tyrosine transport system substrate-binding protein